MRITCIQGPFRAEWNCELFLFTDLRMYICNCMGITEREIRGAVDLGCETVADLGRDLGVGTCCGRCVPEAGRLL
ncbi:MAG TPA: (2Fe-2S)-binding protein, partial [Usitatibacter sp.]|nr:(2Fe-2S)-binding protein [Usitatibacter sp.]